MRAAAEELPEVAAIRNQRARSEAVDAVLAEEIAKNETLLGEDQQIRQAIDTYNGVKHTSGEDFRAMLRQTLGDNAIGLVKEEIAPMETTGYNGSTEKDSNLRKTLNQVVLGNWTDDLTPTGTLMQFGLGIAGLDLPMDLRDLAYDLTHWEQTPAHVKQTLIDLIAVLPVVGGLKYLDEGAALAKGGLKNADEVADAAGDVAKGANKAIAEGAGDDLKIGSFDELPSNAKNSYKGYESTGWKGNYSGQTPGTNAGTLYRNKNNLLPKADSLGNQITYKEFDVNNRIAETGRDAERYIVGSDGSVYYTKDHYTTFTKIK